MAKKTRVMAMMLLAVLALVGWRIGGTANSATAAPWPPLEPTITATVNGDTVTYAITVKNVSAANANQVEIKGSLPAGGTYVQSWLNAPGSGAGKFDTQSVGWIVGTIKPGTSVGPFSYQVKASSTATVHVYLRWLGAELRGEYVSPDVSASGAPATTTTSPATTATTPSTPATKAPAGELQIVPVANNAADPNVILGNLPGTTTTVQMGATGLNVVSVGAPVAVKGISTDSAGPAKTFAWTLTAPSASKAKLDSATAQTVHFTPDVVGIYKVDVVVGNEIGKAAMDSVQIRAGTYIGGQGEACKSCHADKVKEWSETGHAKIMKWQINGGDDPATSHYGEGCLRCHTTGYYIGAANGGFADVQAQTGWKFPSLADIQAGKDNYSAMPASLRAMANIQCEDCHGPAKEHVLNGAPMAKSVDNGVCDQCHNGGGHHIKGGEITFSKHNEADAQAWTYPTGPARQDCVRCHSGDGFASFIANPTEKGSWANNPQTLGCSNCHDPHSDANKFQLRITGKPVEAVGITKNFGLSAVCVECHNARNTGADAVKGSTPHYSAAGEMLSDSGGVDYGQTIPNSPHGLIVGASPVKDATGAALFGDVAPGPCAYCHMYPTLSNAKDPNYMKVGEHSFNVVSPDGKFDYTAACQTCHPGMKDFNFTAKADYDGNGKVEGVQTEVAGLLNVLKKAIADSGIRPITGHPYFNAQDTAKANEKQKNAIYNYLFVRGVDGTDGVAASIHNFKRSVGLLQASYKDLTGKDMPGATLVK